MKARVIGAAGVVAVLLAGGVTLWQGWSVNGGVIEQAADAASRVPSISVEPVAAPVRPVATGLKRYHNDVLKFSVDYPEELPVSEQASGSALTVSFQRAAGEPGFQIFAVPYTDEQITKERFLYDVPSGVMRDKVDAVVDGAPGVAFYSTNMAMGDTYEIWFLYDGYLYEVTTYKELDTGLQSIMQTWKFL